MKKKLQNEVSRCLDVVQQSKKMKWLMMMIVSITIFSCSADEFEPKKNTAVVSNEVLPTEEKSTTGKKFSHYESLKNWMNGLPDQTDITKITIPGTHNSAARFDYKAGPITLQNAGKTQNLTIASQLNIGVRFLDIRCKIKNNNLAIYHGIADQKQTLEDVLNAVEKFLRENPSEFVFLSIKKEENKDSSSEFERLLRSNFSKSKFWNKLYKNNNEFPAIKDVRGKIVLIKRFYGFSEAGYNAASGWMDDSKNFIISNNNYLFNVQDAYSVSYSDDKVNNIKKQMIRAQNSTNKNELFLNFYSGYKSMFGKVPNVRSVSNYVNPKLNSYVSKTDVTQSGLGVCILDFIDESLSKTIVDVNRPYEITNPIWIEYDLVECEVL